VQWYMGLNGPDGSIVDVSENGFITTPLWRIFVTHFLTNTSRKTPILLLLDGHTTHFPHDVLWRLLENNVHAVCLPPHSTHLLQPLDKGMFPFLKQVWIQAKKEWVDMHLCMAIPKPELSSILRAPYTRACEPKYITAGWKRTGLSPWHPERILDSEYVKKADALAETRAKIEAKAGNDVKKSRPNVKAKSSSGVVVTNRQSLDSYLAEYFAAREQAVTQPAGSDVNGNRDDGREGVLALVEKKYQKSIYAYQGGSANLMTSPLVIQAIKEREDTKAKQEEEKQDKRKKREEKRATAKAKTVTMYSILGLKVGSPSC